MYQFLNDYSETAHPDILNALQDLEGHQYAGYGNDALTQQIRQHLQTGLDNDSLAIHFCSSGTQANLVCLAALLSPIDGIIACSSGHIAANEAGAIEALGHKVILAEPQEGKLTIAEIDKLCQRHAFQPHVVRAKAIYISNATELGTVYSYTELQTLYDYCQAYNMFVFMDGARLGVALASDKSNTNNTSHEQSPTLTDITKFTDMFWLGGTKMGALFGEMIVIPNPALAVDFDIHLKQRGALLAKGFILAVQFAEMLREDKYLTWCHHANRMAQKLAQGLQTKGHELLVPTQTNQVFACLPATLIAHLQQQFGFYEWQPLNDGRSVIRLVTSWSTPETDIDAFIKTVKDF